jgi:hypothetical protein
MSIGAPSCVRLGTTSSGGERVDHDRVRSVELGFGRLLRGDRSLCPCSATHRCDAAEDSGAASISTRAVTLLCRRQHYDLGDQHQELHAAIASAAVITADRCSSSPSSWASPWADVEDTWPAGAPPRARVRRAAELQPTRSESMCLRHAPRAARAQARPAGSSSQAPKSSCRRRHRDQPTLLVADSLPPPSPPCW